MARTIRSVPHNKHLRTPRYRWKLLAGISRKHIVDDFSDKPIAAKKEMHGKRRSFIARFPNGLRSWRLHERSAP